ncbi:MAG: ATP-binding protein [Sedimentisphaerales bacterium]|nr:ATP-binding protein [Sedimentisphaerales bacterium]
MIMNGASFQTVQINSDFHLAKEVEDQIISAAQTSGYDEDVIFALRLSVEEALSNAIRHGNAYDVKKKVHVRYSVSPDRIDVYVSDEGRGFDPGGVPDPTAPENLENPSGRGIMLMRAYMNQVEFNDAGNEVHLVKLNQAS